MSLRTATKQLSYGLIAVAVGSIVGLVITEGILRWFGFSPGVATVTREQYETIPGIFAPNQRVVAGSYVSLPHRVTINSLGYRGPNFPERKDDTEFRLFVSGDSYVFGSFVDDQQTLPAQLEGQLRVHCGNVRVINGGLGGSMIVDQVKLIERALPLAPDLVLLVFSENDVTDLAQSTSLWDQLAQARLTKSRFPLSLVYPLLNRTALWYLALQARSVLRARGMKEADRSQRDVAADGLILRLRERYREALVAVRGMLAERNIPFVFAVFPSHHSVNGRLLSEQLSWVIGVPRTVGIPAINLLPALRETGLPKPTLFLLPRDGHPGPVGYDVAARFLADQLAQDGPLATLCRGMRQAEGSRLGGLTVIDGYRLTDARRGRTVGQLIRPRSVGWHLPTPSPGL